MKITGFTKHNPKYASLNHPEEDSFKFNYDKSEIVVAVADGITRDPKGIPIFPEFSEKDKLIEAAKNYPRPSFAKKVADLFCNSFLKKRSFKFCNEEIKKFNKNLKVDYLENDFYACVAVGGIVKNNILNYEFIADCGVTVFDSEGKLKFRSKNEGPSKLIDEEIKQKYKTSFKFSEGRKLIRSKYRNNPNEPLSYGALTGEKNALVFVKSGKVQVQSRDYILFYSDGMDKIIYSKEFNISKNFDELEKHIDNNLININGSEGTLVAVKI